MAKARRYDYTAFIHYDDNDQYAAFSVKAGEDIKDARKATFETVAKANGWDINDPDDDVESRVTILFIQEGHQTDAIIYVDGDAIEEEGDEG